MNDNDLPEYLKHWPGLSMRQGDAIVQALPEDVAVAKSYPTAKEKGPLIGGQRITLLTKKTRYQAGEDVRVIHVLEIVEPGHQLFVMGRRQSTESSSTESSSRRRSRRPSSTTASSSIARTSITTTTSPRTVSPSRDTTRFSGGSALFGRTRWSSRSPLRDRGVLAEEPGVRFSAKLFREIPK